MHIEWLTYYTYLTSEDWKTYFVIHSSGIYNLVDILESHAYKW